MERGDMLILKRLKAPTTKDFETMLNKGHTHAKKQGITEKDVLESIKKVRMRT